MIGKITKGASFKALVSYILDNKKNAKLIDCKGVLFASRDDIARSFEMQAMLNPSLKHKVGHISLNFHKNDTPLLTNEFMEQVAREYLKRMGIVNTQYIIGRHYDKEHPHIHICYNRVDNEGKTISDKNDRVRNAKITNRLTKEHGLYYSTGKQDVKIHRLREPQKTQHQIYHSLKSATSIAANWEELKYLLEKDGVEIDFKHKSNSDEIQGVKFTKNGYSFSGSKISKKFSYSKIDFALTQNEIEFNKLEDNSLNHNTKEDFNLEESIFSTVLDIAASNNSMDSDNENEQENDNNKKRTRRRQL